VVVRVVRVGVRIGAVCVMVVRVVRVGVVRVSARVVRVIVRAVKIGRIGVSFARDRRMRAFGHEELWRET
jgi:hypothetical protein